MAGKGAPKGTRYGGREKGTRNKRTLATERAMQEAAARIEAAIPEAFKGDAHELLMAVYKDTLQPMMIRLDAAKAAAPYEKHRLSAIEHTGKDGGPMQVGAPSELELARRIAFVLAKGERAREGEE